jgi:hypothetical protein
MEKHSVADAQPERARKAQGMSSFIVATLTVVLFLGLIGLIEWVSWDERQSWERQRALHPGGKVATSAPLAQALLFGAGICTGGVMSLVGLGLSIGGLYRRPRTLALWGLALNLLGLTLVVAWFLVRHSEVRLS